jgi:hypothetical protein
MTLKFSSLRKALLGSHFCRSATVFPLTDIASFLAQDSQMLDLHMVLEVFLGITGFATVTPILKLPLAGMSS